MNPTLPSIAVARAARMFIFIVLLCLVSRVQARVIDVGPQRAVRTLDAAVARAAVGDEIVLDRGVEHLTAGVRITTDAIEIRSADGPGERATIRNVSTRESATTIEHRGEGLVLKDLLFTGGPRVTCVGARGRRLTIDNAEPTNAVWRWVHIAGGSQTTIRNCDVPKLRSYAVCSFDHEARLLLIERCTFAGGDGESHTIRLQKIHAAHLRDCTISGGGARSALSIRDGADNRVEGCTINGRLYLGPLADGDGGIRHPTVTAADRAKREALLRRTQRNLMFRDCTIDTDGITVEMGVQGLIFDACRIKTTRPWALRLNQDEYAPWRSVPSGRVVNCELTGPAGLKVFEHARPDFVVTGTSVNGVRIPDSAPATTNPAPPGGTAPGEVKPTTLPTTTAPSTRPSGPRISGEVRRADVLDAIDHVEAALHRLHSATQPSR